MTFEQTGRIQRYFLKEPRADDKANMETPIPYYSDSKECNTGMTTSQPVWNLREQLLLASKEELVQILLEVGNNNCDALNYISSKARRLVYCRQEEACPVSEPNTPLLPRQFYHSTLEVKRIVLDEDSVKLTRDQLRLPEVKKVRETRNEIMLPDNNTFKHQDHDFSKDNHSCLKVYRTCSNTQNSRMTPIEQLLWSPIPECNTPRRHPNMVDYRSDSDMLERISLEDYNSTRRCLYDSFAAVADYSNYELAGESAVSGDTLGAYTGAEEDDTDENENNAPEPGIQTRTHSPES